MVPGYDPSKLSKADVPAEREEFTLPNPK